MAEPGTLLAGRYGIFPSKATGASRSRKRKACQAGFSRLRGRSCEKQRERNHVVYGVCRRGRRLDLLGSGNTGRREALLQVSAAPATQWCLPGHPIYQKGRGSQTLKWFPTRGSPPQQGLFMTTEGAPGIWARQVGAEGSFSNGSSYLAPRCCGHTLCAHLSTVV